MQRLRTPSVQDMTHLLLDWPASAILWWPASLTCFDLTTQLNVCMSYEVAFSVVFCYMLYICRRIIISFETTLSKQPTAFCSNRRIFENTYNFYLCFVPSRKLKRCSETHLIKWLTQNKQINVHTANDWRASSGIFLENLCFYRKRAMFLILNKLIELMHQQMI